MELGRFFDVYTRRSIPEPYYATYLEDRAGNPLSSRTALLPIQLGPISLHRSTPSTKTDFYQINAQGFRGRDWNEARSRQHRLVLSGGSTFFVETLSSEHNVFREKP